MIVKAQSAPFTDAATFLIQRRINAPGQSMSDDSQVMRVQGLLDRLAAGEPGARDALISLAFERLSGLASVMLREYPGVGRWEGTDDVLQGAALRLYRALDDVKPATPGDFFRFATVHIRRELIDLARRFAGPYGLGANQESVDPDRSPGIVELARDFSHDPAQLAEWSSFHQHVQSLPDEQRAAFDLIYYQGLPQEEAAETLQISLSSLKRHWQKARLALHDAMGGRLPGV
jgi:RNA polymerase sigma factor (sigma-70 family)